MFENQDTAAGAKEKLNYLNVSLGPGPVEMNRLIETVREGTLLPGGVALLVLVLVLELTKTYTF